MEFRIPIPDQLDDSGIILSSWKSLLKDFLCHLSPEGKESKRELCSLFLYAIGSEANIIFEAFDLIGIDIQKLKALLVIVEDMCVPKLFLLLERFKFFNMKQDKNESLPHFYSRLESHADNCEFGDLRNNLLAQCAAEGVWHPNIQQNLKSKIQLDYAKLFDICKNSAKRSEFEGYTGKEEKSHENNTCNSNSVLISNDTEINLTEGQDNGRALQQKVHGSNTGSDKDNSVSETLKLFNCNKSKTNTFECQLKEGKVDSNLNALEKSQYMYNRTITESSQIDSMANANDARRDGSGNGFLIGFSSQSNEDLLKDSSQTESFSCKHCGSHFRSPSLLKRHQVKHSLDKPYPCQLCGRKYQSKSAMKDHMKKHNNQRDFICSLCGSAFLKNDALKVHQRIHSGEKPYKCDTCNQRFSYLTSLNVHRNSHDKHLNKKPYKYTCEKCGKSFCRKPAFQNHLRVHAGETPYCCSQCDKKFTSKPYLTLHLRIHSQELPYVCDVCGKQFRHATNLHTHKKGRHSGKRSFVCDTCGATYLYLKNLKQHKKCTHAQEGH